MTARSSITPSFVLVKGRIFIAVMNEDSEYGDLAFTIVNKRPHSSTLNFSPPPFAILHS
jgi:hypothetical protein